MGRSDEMFDPDTFDSDDQDVGLVADNHLLNNGPDLYGQRPCDLMAGSLAMAQSNNDIMPFASSASQPATIPPPCGTHYFDHTFEPFQGNEFNTAATGIASPSHQSPSQPTRLQYQDDGFGLIFDIGLPTVPFMPTPAIAPAAVFAGTVMLPGIVPGAPSALPATPAMVLDQQQQRQEFTNQQAQVYLPQPRDLQVRLQQWQVAEGQLDLGLQSPFQPPAEVQLLQNGRSPSRLDSSHRYQSARDSQHAEVSPQQQGILSDEQIQLIQNTESTEYLQPEAQWSSYQATHTATCSPTTSSSSENESLQKTTMNHKARSKRTAHTACRPPAPESGLQEQSPAQTSFPGLTFVSLRDAEAAMASRSIELDWHAPSPDNTIPSSQHDRSEYVLMMFDAFQDTSECKDNKDGFSFLKRWTIPGYYKPQEMEKVCWHMLDVAERLHAQGPTASNIYCEDALKKLKASRGLTFEQRIHAICAMLRFSKNLCDNLLKGEGIETLVGAPKQKMSGAKTMMVQNQKRQKWIMHGRSEDPLHAHVSGNDRLRADEETTQAIKKPKRSPPSAKSRTRTDAHSLQTPDELSDAEDEPAPLLRCSSVVTLGPKQHLDEGSNTDVIATSNALFKDLNWHKGDLDSVFAEGRDKKERDAETNANSKKEEREEDSKLNLSPSPSSLRKRRINVSNRETFTATHSLMATATRFTKPATTAHRHTKHSAQSLLMPQTSNSSHVSNKRKTLVTGTDEHYGPARRLKRTTNGKDEAAQKTKPATLVVSKGAVKSKNGKPLRDAQGRFIRR